MSPPSLGGSPGPLDSKTRIIAAPVMPRCLQGLPLTLRNKNRRSAQMDLTGHHQRALP